MQQPQYAGQPLEGSRLAKMFASAIWGGGDDGSWSDRGWGQGERGPVGGHACGSPTEVEPLALLLLLLLRLSMRLSVAVRLARSTAAGDSR